MQGVVLAGGQSRRMGISKTDLIGPDGLTLLNHARHTLEEVCTGTVWISRPFGFYPVSASDLVDTQPDVGPLSGIALALGEGHDDLTAVLAVDLPRVTASLFTSLYNFWLSNPRLDIVYAETTDQITQPLAALWHVRALPVIRRVMTESKSARVKDVVHAVPSASVTVSSDVLANMNTPQDWALFQKAGLR